MAAMKVGRLVPDRATSRVIIVALLCQCGAGASQFLVDWPLAEHTTPRALSTMMQLNLNDPFADISLFLSEYRAVMCEDRRLHYPFPRE